MKCLCVLAVLLMTLVMVFAAASASAATEQVGDLSGVDKRSRHMFRFRHARGDPEMAESDKAFRFRNMLDSTDLLDQLYLDQLLSSSAPEKRSFGAHRFRFRGAKRSDPSPVDNEVVQKRGGPFRFRFRSA